MAEKKRKLKKSCDASLCCKKCGYYNDSNKEHPICSLDSKEVEQDGYCKSFDGSIQRECARCHRKVKYGSVEEFYNNVIKFSMDSGSGSGSGQNVHLCKTCALDAFEMFHDLLEKIRRP